MDRESLLTQLRAWAEGFDPASGEALPPDHPAQRPSTLRVVYAALAALEAQKVAGGGVRGYVGPRNAGRAWSSADEESLASAFDAGESIASIATRLERTRARSTRVS